MLTLSAVPVYADLIIKDGKVYKDYYKEGNYRGEIDKLQFYLFKSLSNYKYVYEVEDLHSYLMSKFNPELKFYRGNLTVSLNTVLFNNPDFLLGAGIAWYVQYSSPTCDALDFKKGKIKKCMWISYLIDKPEDENKAYFSIEKIEFILDDNKSMKLKNRQILFREEFTEYGD